MTEQDRPKCETDNCRHRLIKYCQGQGLDIGCSFGRITTNAIGIDLYSSFADMRIDARDLSVFPNEHFDFVYSSHLLEELENTEATLKEWLRVLKPGGYMVLYQADRDYYYPLDDPRCNKSHKHHFIWEELWAIFEKIGGAKLIHQGRYGQEPFGEWSFELVVRKNGEEPVITDKSTAFKIMIVGGPAEKYISRCLDSVITQNYPNWKARVILDPVNDKTYENAIKFKDDRISIKLNDSRKYNVANFIEAAKLLNPDDDDIMVMIDADDWLAGVGVLNKLRNYYEKNKKLLLTHGSWQPYPNMGSPNNNFSYSEEDFRRGLRGVPWRASHLRTCKYKLWKHLKEEDFKNEKGEFYSVTGDLALMYPLMEMAGFNRIKFIPEILYIYNKETEFSDEKIKRQEQLDTETYIKKQSPQPYRDNLMLNCLIFSKDRACQLDLLLRSIKQYWDDFDISSISVLWKASSEEYRKGYEILKKEQPEFIYKEETSFKQDVLSLLDFNNTYAMFMVDDLIFKNPFALDCEAFDIFKRSKDIMSFSLRLYPGIKRCHPRNMNTIPPTFMENFIWKWKEQEGDWSYPWSIDANIFRTSDIKDILLNKLYLHPNDFEKILMDFMPQKPFMICLEKSIVVNNPQNNVGMIKNIHGNITAESLNTEYLSGKRISLEPYKGIDTVSPHQEMEIIWL